MSKYDTTLTTLANELADAAFRDAKSGFDIGAGHIGENVSEWLKLTAEALSGEKRFEPETVMFCGRPSEEGDCDRRVGRQHRCLLADGLCGDQVPF